MAAVVLTAAPAAAEGATVTRTGSTVVFNADQGERNDLLVSQGVLFSNHVFTFTDGGASLAAATGFCDIIDGVGMCTASGVTRIRVNLRDRDDSVKVDVSTSIGPVITPTTLIGGRGADVLIGGSGRDRLKGNNGRDSLRGRKGRDAYKGGRGSDVIQALDGKADKLITCGEGRRDLLRADRVDPRPKSCELGGRKRRGKRP
jgi:Ca2+-binding RTX toxin-like protein